MEQTTSHDQLLFVDSDSANGDLGRFFRKTRPGPERDLIESFLQSMPFHVPRDCRATILREPRLESGFPDLVIVIWREEVTHSWGSKRLNLKAVDLRLMHFLYSTGHATEKELAAIYGRQAAESIERLSHASMIQPLGSSWMPCSLTESFAASKIIAIEAKIGKRAEVLNQALLNTWFASTSYVLVPDPLSNVWLDVAQRFGIGVWSLNGHEIQEYVGAAMSLPRSYASWVLNDLAWRSSRRIKDVE